MKPFQTKSCVTSLLVLAALALLGGGNAFALRWTAFTFATGTDSYGVIGIGANWETRVAAKNAAVEDARGRNGGVLRGYYSTLSSNHGWGAVARGFKLQANGTYRVRFFSTNGWKTRAAAIATSNRHLGPFKSRVQVLAGFNDR